MCRTGTDCLFMAGMLGLCLTLLVVFALLKLEDWLKGRRGRK